LSFVIVLKSVYIIVMPGDAVLGKVCVFLSLQVLEIFIYVYVWQIS